MKIKDRIGSYRILELVASSPMSEVILAEKDLSAGCSRTVILKRISWSMRRDQELRSLFLEELYLHSLVTHPNIAQLHDAFWDDDDDLYLVLEYIRGVDLGTCVARFRELPQVSRISFTLRIISDLLTALHCVHTLKAGTGKPLKVVHQDVSPSNILISYMGQAKLCDFGLAKSSNSHADSGLGVLKGKMRYMAPEQCAMGPIDHRADLFAAGICFWELLFGQRLFNQESDALASKAIRRGLYPFPAPSNQAPWPNLRDVVCKALSPTLEARYQSAGEFLNDCRALIQTLPSHHSSIELGEFLENNAAPAQTQGVQRLAPITLDHQRSAGTWAHILAITISLPFLVLLWPLRIAQFLRPKARSKLKDSPT